MYKPSPSVQDFTAHTRCISAAAGHPTLISIFRFSRILTLKDTLRHLIEELCLALRRVLTRTWTGLCTGKSIGEHLPVGMVLNLGSLRKGTTTKHSTGHTRPQMVASGLLQ